MRLASFLGLVVSLTAASIGTGVRAQEVDGFRGSDDDSPSERPYCGLSRTSEFRFQQLSAGEPAPPATPTLTLGPFDDAVYCFRTVEVFAVDVLPMSQFGGWRSHQINLTIHLVGSAHDSWWKLVRSDGKTPWSEVLDSDAPALSEVRWALPGAREPMLEATIRSDAAGMGQRSQEHLHVLVDLRSAAPEVLGSYLLGGAEYGGMPCTWGAALPEKRQFSCVWDPLFGDYRCSSGSEYELPWIRYRHQRCFHLRSGIDFPCPGLAPLPVISPTDAIREANDTPDSVVRKLVSTEKGIATVLAAFPPTPTDTGAIVLGSASDGVEFDPLFFLLTTGSGGKAQLKELDVSYVDLQDQVEGSGSSGYEEWHARPAIPRVLGLVSSALLSDRDRFRLYRLVVEQGRARALVLVALDNSGAEQRAEALVVATEAVYRGRCGDNLYPATAVIYEASREGLPARLAVEPDFKEDGIQPHSRGGCAQIMELHWEHDQGFVLNKESEDCREHLPVRRVKIADDGALSFTLVRAD